MAKRTGSIVTYVHHYRRPPPKKLAKPPIAVPAVVERDAPKQPIETEELRESPSIVTNKSKKELKLMRQERAREKAAKIDDPEEVARVRAFIKRMTKPPDEK